MNTQCIYCKRSGVPFSQEHVLPQMFGRFEENPTLHCVCQEDNGAFGRTFETRFGRDSLDAVLRLLFRLKSPNESHHVARRHTSVTVREGYWEGTRIDFVPGESNGLLNASIPPQVVIRLEARPEPISLRLGELTPERLATYVRSSVVRVTGSAEEREQLIQRLLNCGVKFTGEQVIVESPPPIEGDLLLEIEVLADTAIARAVYKIAFNFLAATKGCEFVLDSRFDTVRAFVLGGNPDLTFGLEFQEEPIFRNSDGSSAGDGHALTLHRDSAYPGGLVAQVGLFNRHIYRVGLTDRLGADEVFPQIAYFFDLTTRRAVRVT